MEKLAEKAEDKIIPLASEVLSKKKKGTITNEDYKDFESTLGELARSVLVGHKELLDMALVISKVSASPNEVKYFTEKHSMHDIREHFVTLAAEFH